MNHFSGYEEYCGAFSDKEKCATAKLIYFARCRLSEIAQQAKQGESFFGTDGFSFGEFCAPGRDALSEIICAVKEDAAYIAANMREKLVRENDLIPIYKVRELNSTSMNWISRRPGRTIAEKLSGSKEILGVNRRMSLDTGENRLFLAFMKRLAELIELKNESLPPKLLQVEEEYFLEFAQSFINSDCVKEIARWENLPPNNTLLSDRHYRHIWNGWTELRELDELVERDCDNIGAILATLFFWKLFSEVAQRYRFPQTPVIVDSRNFVVFPDTGTLSGIAEDKTEMKMYMEKDRIYLFVNGNEAVATFCGREFSLTVNGTTTLREVITAQRFDALVEKAVKALGIVKNRSAKGNVCDCDKGGVCLSADRVYVDIFAGEPCFAADEKAVKPLGIRFAVQKYNFDSPENCFLSLANSTAFCVDNAEKIITPRGCGEEDDAYTLFSDISGRIKAKKFCFLFPDSLNEFRLTPIRKAAHLFYNDIDAVPLSIGAVFGCETRREFRSGFCPEDIYLVVDIVGSELTITPVKGVPDNSAGVERMSVVWERYPTACYELQTDREESMLTELFPTGLSASSKDFPVLVGDSWEAVGKIAEDIPECSIDEYISRYIASHRYLTADCFPKIIALSNKLKYEGDFPIFRVSGEMCVTGHRLCSDYSRQVGKALWKDHLPDLSLRQVLTTFDLVKNQTVIPRPGEEIDIEISNRFTLPAGKERYSFELVQSDSNVRMKFRAVLEHSAFPLKTPAECILRMRYKYGADEPYTLTFIPIDKKAAGFSEVTAKWQENDADLPDEAADKIYPNFPAAPDIAMLRHFPPKHLRKDYSDLIERVINAFSPQFSYRFTGEEIWNSDKNGYYNTFIPVYVNGITIKVQIYKNEVINRAEEIYFRIEERNFDFYRATDICPKTEYFFQPHFASTLFALHNILSGGRKIDDPSLPTELAEAVRGSIGDALSAYITHSERLSKNGEISDAEKKERRGLSTLFSILCLLHGELSEEFSELISNNLTAAEKPQTYLDSNIALVVGGCETDEEKALFERIATVCRKNFPRRVHILSRALWKQPDLVFNANPQTLLTCLNKAVDVLENFARNCANPNSNREKLLKAARRGEVTASLEYILAVFRLRELGNKEINAQLRPGSPVINKLREALYRIVQANDSEIFSLIKERARVQLGNGGSTNIPAIIYAVMQYSSGQLEGDSIIISGISEED